MQRRHFILTTGGLVGAILAPAASPSTIRLAGFRELTGQEFIIYQNKRGIRANLYEVRAPASQPRLEQFSLFFSIATDLPAGAYDVENASTGQIPMYLEPAGQGRMRADFSLLV